MVAIAAPAIYASTVRHPSAHPAAYDKGIGYHEFTIRTYRPCEAAAMDITGYRTIIQARIFIIIYKTGVTAKTSQII